MSLLDDVTAFAKSNYLERDWPHIIEVVTLARLLAARTGADSETVTIAAYLHDISRATLGPKNHNVKSSEMAGEWLRQHGYPEERIERVTSAIESHLRPKTGPERLEVSLEGRILYDADKINRARGMALVGALVHLGSQSTWEGLNYQQLRAAIRRGSDASAEVLDSLYTDAARELALPGYRQTRDFCDYLLSMEIFSS